MLRCWPAAALAAPMIAAAPGGTSQHGPQRVAAPAPLVRHVATHGAVEVVSLDRRRVAQRDRVVLDAFPLPDEPAVDLVLERFKVTTPRTRFVASDGRPVAFDPDRVTLLRGEVAGRPGSHVYLALSDTSSAGMIDLGPGARRFDVTSRSGAGIDLAAGELAVFEPGPGIGPLLGVPVCGVEGPATARTVSGANSPGMKTLELAIDADYEYYSLFGDLTAAMDYIVQLYGAVCDIYVRDVNTRVEVTFVRVFDTDTDPYNASDPLNDFVDEWDTGPMSGTPRDAAQLLTGRRNLPYGGVAYVEATCFFGYSVTGYILGAFPSLNVPSTGTWDVIVTSHELGHNCGTFHTHDYGIDNCAGGDLQRGTIMSYCHTTPGGNANIDLRFHTEIQTVIEAYLGSVDCLIDDCNGNGIDDADDIAGASDDVNLDGVPDECQDCNGNFVLDPDDIAGASNDVNGNGIPDECEPDCDGDDVPDDHEIALGAPDANGDGVPDGCQANCNANGTPDYDEIQADMTLDLDRNAVLDECQDCDGNGSTDAEVLDGANNWWVAGAADDRVSEMHGGTGVLVSTAGAGVLSNPQDVLVRSDGHVLVSNFAGSVSEFDADGAHLGSLVAAGSGGLGGAAGMIIASGGDLLVASRATDSVLAYDAVTGASLGAFVASGAGGLVDPFGLAFGPNGNLFVSCGDDAVREYDGSTGSSVGTLVSAGSGGLSNPKALLFKPDGDLLVASHDNDEILEYDGQTGAFLGQWNIGGLTSGFWALDGPWDMEIGPNGFVFVTSRFGNAAVHMYDVDTGTFTRSFYVLAAAGPLSEASGLAYVDGLAIDCNLNFVPDTCDIDSGASHDENGNSVPDECDTPGDVNGDGIVGVDDFLAVLAAWGPCADCDACPADVDDDCIVEVDDFLLVLANWTT